MELFTVGHSALDIKKFLDLLKRYNINALIDIRSIPYSRRTPQYNKTAMTVSLQEEGISYTYLGDCLGGFPKDPLVYRSGRVPKTWSELAQEIDYQSIMKKDWYQEGIEALVSKGKDNQLVILCAEENPADCHRQHLVAQSLLVLGIHVTHIRHDGMSQPAWLDTKEDL